MSTLVIGYYNQFNHGDDLFEYTIANVSTCNPVFENIEKFTKTFPKTPDVYTTNYSTFVFGGGNIINRYYFSDELLCALRQASLGCGTKIVFFGIGITYPNLISDEHLLDIADAVFVRSSQDYDIVAKRIPAVDSGVVSVYKMPNMVFKLAERFPRRDSRTPTRRIGIALPYTWLSSRTHDTFRNELEDLIHEIRSLGYTPVFIGFDSDEFKGRRCNDSVYSDMIRTDKTDDLESHCGKECRTVEGMQRLFAGLDLVIGGRFHSIVLAMTMGIPFVAVGMSKKLTNLKHDLPDSLKELFTELDTCDDTNRPVSLQTGKILQCVSRAFDNIETICADIDTFRTNACELVTRAFVTFDQFVKTGKQRLTAPVYISDPELDDTVSKCAIAVLKCMNKFTNKNYVSIMSGRKTLRDFLPKSQDTSYSTCKAVLASEILYEITGDFYAPYFYGLVDNIVDAKFTQQVRWVVSDYYSNYKYKTNSKIQMINVNFQKLHVSGWDFVVKNIAQILKDVGESTRRDGTTGVDIVDTYMDKTFLWNREFYAEKGVIPYTKPFIGFVHHTLCDFINEYNCTEMVKQKEFLDSMPHCKGIIVLTKYLQRKLTDLLADTGIVGVPVIHMDHPTEFVGTMFSPEAFVANEEHTLAQIGSWLRDVSAISRVEVPESTKWTKVLVQNVNSDNYVLQDNFLDDLAMSFNDDKRKKTKHTSHDICKWDTSNVYTKFLFENLVKQSESYSVVGPLDNCDYNNLLVSNVVFLNLIDASACNTLIECVVRGTPVIVNKIEPVVELLGADYPLYYTQMYQVSQILLNTSKILRAHYCIVENVALRERLSIGTFVKAFKALLDVV